MPSTPIYGLPFEHPVTDQPGNTLNGGEMGLDPILAELTEAALNGVQTDLEGRTFDLESLINALAGQAAVTLDVIDTGAGTNTTEFADISQDYQHLAIFWAGNHDGAGRASLALRFNGDGSTAAYVSVLATGIPTSWTIGSGTEFTVLRGGEIGTTGSGGVVFLPSYNVSGRKASVGISSANAAGTPAISIGAGYWDASTDPITAVRIWPSAQLWGTNPRLSLVGIK